MNYPLFQPETLRKLEWCMSPTQFEIDWPSPSLESDGIWHFGPKGKKTGYGAALTQAAAESQRNKIREAYVRKSNSIVWC